MHTHLAVTSWLNIYIATAFYSKLFNCCPNLRELTFTGWVDDPKITNAHNSDGDYHADLHEPRPDERFWDTQVVAALNLVLSRHQAGANPDTMLDRVTLEIGSPRPARAHLERYVEAFRRLDTVLFRLSEPPETPASADANDSDALQKVVVRHRRDYSDEYMFFSIDQRGRFGEDDQKCLEEMFPKLAAKGILSIEEF